MTVARLDAREAVVDLGPDFPVPLTVGLEFTVSPQLLPAVQIHGQIREIAPQADQVQAELDKGHQAYVVYRRTHCA